MWLIKLLVIIEVFYKMNVMKKNFIFRKMNIIICYVYKILDS